MNLFCLIDYYQVTAHEKSLLKCHTNTTKMKMRKYNDIQIAKEKYRGATSAVAAIIDGGKVDSPV